MDKRNLINMTLALYRVTEFFPRGETLKWVLRDKANEVLAGAILIFSKNPVKLIAEEKNEISKEVLKNLEIIDGYFEIAREQNWVDKKNFFVLGKEYNILRKELENVKIEDKKGEIGTKKERLSYSKDREISNERAKKILEILRDKEKAQVWEFKNIFPEVTKRTLRRDFEYLLSQGLVERIGEGKYTFYKIKQ
jgi:DNA-binding transcriptional ArsR family regulator